MNALKDFETFCQCPICGEVMDTKQIPVSLVPCLHTFCSECVRNALKVKPQCPVCREKIRNYGASSGWYVCNKTMEMNVIHLRRMNDEIIASTKSEVGTKFSRSYGKSQQDNDSECLVLDNDKVRLQKYYRKSVSTNLMKRMPSLSYKLIKKSEIKQMLQKEGLSSSGTEDEMKARHKEFVTLWNSECDSSAPRTKAEIASEVNKREKARLKASHESLRNGSTIQNKCLDAIKDKISNMNTGEAKTVNSGNAAFDKQLNDGFKKLIAEARSRKSRIDTTEVVTDGTPEEIVHYEDDEFASSSGRSLKLPSRYKDADVERSSVNDETTSSVDSSYLENNYSTSKKQGGRKRKVKDLRDTQKKSKSLKLKEEHEDNLPANSVIVPPSDSKKNNCEESQFLKVLDLTEEKNEDSGRISIEPTSCAKFIGHSKKPLINSSSSPATVGPWDCVVCTYHNNKTPYTTSNGKCEMCNSARPGSYQSKMRTRRR